MIHYTGTITTTGTSEAIRLDKALFKAHPEFRRKARVDATVIAPGRLLISLLDDGNGASEEEDPVFSAFLAFLEEDMKSEPHLITSLSASESVLSPAIELTKNVQVSDEDELPDNVGF